MRQGFVAWMRSGSKYCGAAACTATDPHATAPLVAHQFAAELVRELANMAMVDSREVNA
jgi:hypothetical protein